MKYIIQDREPKELFAYFETISAIPRGSYHEEGIASYLEQFAAENGLECYRDALHNVLIKKPATKGQEDRPALLLQGHTDMVCEKNADVVHDFLRDPLELFTDGKLLRARGTTLGADDGIAVAAMLAVLSGALSAHPAIECLFTTAEEVGLNGAHGFDYSRIKARRMINMDSEELGVVTCGCAGGLRHDLTRILTPEPFCGNALRISVSGLMGGHSGENIKDGRANANKVMGRLLAALPAAWDTRLVTLSGGSKDNAIPRECEAILSVPDAERAIDLLTETAAEIAHELVKEDRGFTVTVEETVPSDHIYTKADTAAVIGILAGAANGVLAMSRDVAGLVEFSRNLGVVRTERDKIDFVFSSRSAMEGRLDASMQELDALAAITGCTAKHYSRYPGWDYAATSAVRDAYLQAYKDVTGEQAKVNVIHAGLECGIIRSKVPDMDIISVGPTMHDIHSPAEALDLDATEIFWKTVVRLVEII